MPYLKQQGSGGRIEMSWILGRQPFTVGRNDDTSAPIADNGISGLHFRIEEVDGVHYIVDEDSTNGTFVNDGKVKRRQLEDGDIIRAGSTTFQYEYGVSTMIGGMEDAAGRSIRSELKDLYQGFEDE